VAEQRLHAGFRQQADRPRHRLETIGPQADLGGTLLAADVQDLAPALLNPAGHLETQGRLSNPGRAPQQRHRPGNRSASQNAIQFAYSTRQARQTVDFDLSEGQGLVSPGGRARTAPCRTRGGFFHEAIPAAALGAATESPWLLGAALGAGVDASSLGHAAHYRVLGLSTLP